MRFYVAKCNTRIEAVSDDDYNVKISRDGVMIESLRLPPSGVEIVPSFFGNEPHVRGVLKRTVATAIRVADFHFGAGLQDAMQFIHKHNQIADMFNDVRRKRFRDAVVSERPWRDAQVVHHVDAGCSHDVDADETFAFPLAASQVEFFTRRYR